MTFHQGSAVSLAMMTAATVIVVGYRSGRTRSAWRQMHDARQAARVTRRHAWAHTARFVIGLVVVLAGLFAAAYRAGH